MPLWLHAPLTLAECLSFVAYRGIYLSAMSGGQCAAMPAAIASLLGLPLAAPGTPVCIEPWFLLAALAIFGAPDACHWAWHRYLERQKWLLARSTSMAAARRQGPGKGEPEQASEGGDEDDVAAASAASVGKATMASENGHEAVGMQAGGAVADGGGSGGSAVAVAADIGTAAPVAAVVGGGGRKDTGGVLVVVSTSVYPQQPQQQQQEQPGENAEHEAITPVAFPGPAGPVEDDAAASSVAEQRRRVLEGQQWEHQSYTLSVKVRKVN